MVIMPILLLAATRLAALHATPPAFAAADTACPSPEAVIGRYGEPLDSAPFDSVTFTVGQAPVKICYGRPSAHKRLMLGGAVPYGERWTPGHVVLFTPGYLYLAGFPLDAGAYVLRFVPQETEWIVTIDGYAPATAQQPGDRGAGPIRAGRIVIPREWLPESVETFTIRPDLAAGADTASAFVVEWEKTHLRIPVRRSAQRGNFGEDIVHCAGPRLDDRLPIGYCYPLPSPRPVDRESRNTRGSRRLAARPVRHYGAAIVVDTLCPKVKIGNPPDTIPDTERAVSPLDSLTIAVGGAPVKFCYGRPSARGRLMLGGHQPYGNYWRTGANEPTTFTTPIPLAMAGVAVPPGRYSLYTIPGEQNWTIVIDRSTDRWGNDLPDIGQRWPSEVGRGTVGREWMPRHVETLTFRPDRRNGDASALVLEWEWTRVHIPLAPR